MAKTTTWLPSVLEKQHDELLAGWLANLRSDIQNGAGRISDGELQEQASQFLKLLAAGTRNAVDDIARPDWEEMLHFLSGVAQTRAVQGFTPSQIATFILSCKRPLFDALQVAVGDKESLVKEMWRCSELLDNLSLHTMRTFQQAREEVIRRQQEELLELSTPVVKLWEGILALPMIGTLDSSRTQVVMEALLQRLVDTGSQTAIIDITGVPTVDTLVAQHLLRTVTAIRLMGADCIISGVRPQIAQTIVHLGVDLQGVTTKANLADALALAFHRSGLTVTKAKV
jgi:rsbT co-antagonist protein RsbR